MKKLGKILLFIVIGFVLIIGGGIIYITKGLNSGKDIIVNEINLENVEDGVYLGKYEYERWTNEVEVTVENHKITNIKIIKDVTFVNPTVSTEVINKVIEEQSSAIEISSGATVTSKAYLKAIEDALNN